MAQKYAIKGQVRSCQKWSELWELIRKSIDTNLISYTSFEKLSYSYHKADRDDIGEFIELKKKLLKALAGGKI